ncbi:hypothetical protein PSHT_05881 [Puccinia striiformis]|uniref:tRNA (guanine(10)-N(2))-methyltransferase TRMT11 N-terminal domain-containing protein n=1 Tax=Puccinia striiformis TaxID=27350 RepID=A0A2S4W9J8_9BASI|nr:hypothetical protein PSHT_05881 [Puccinia striiformis]
MAPQIYIIIFAQAYEEFRLPELESIDVLFNLGIDYLGLEIDVYRPYMKIGLENEEKARLLGSRAILIKHIIRHWADAPSYPELHLLNQENESLWGGYAEIHTFKVTVNSYKATLTQTRKKEIIESLSYMAFKGEIILQDPQVEIMIIEEDLVGSKNLRRSRNLVDKFDLKKRIYGVRAGAKRLGRKDESKLRSEPYKLPDGTWSHEKPDYVPPSKPWEMSEVLDGLLLFASQMLKPNGRLVYWLPTASQDYNHSDLPHLNGLKLIANSCQDFGKWQRRLITMQKEDPDQLDTSSELLDDFKDLKIDDSPPPLLGHRHFRDKYMKGFS